MTKYFFLLIVQLFFFSVGCDKDTTQDIILDSELYGEWRSDITICDYYRRIFYDDGKCSFLYLNYWEGDVECEHIDISEYWISDYWIEDDYILFEYNDGSIESLPYSVSGDELILGHSNEQYVYERQ